jgi:hypothetical protein
MKTRATNREGGWDRRDWQRALRLAELVLVCAASCLFRPEAASGAGSVQLAWDPNTEPDIAGYRVYYGTFSRAYSQWLDAGNVTNATVTSLANQTSYYFAVTAWNTAGLESDYSNEVVYQTPGGATSLAVTSSVNPALPGTTITFTATVTVVPPGTGTPTDAVIFKDGTTSLGTNSLNGSGVAVFSTSSLSHDSHTITAEYAGNADFGGSTNILTPNQVINTPPVAVADVIERYPTEGVKMAITDLLINDSDPDGDTIVFTGVASNSTYDGTVASSPDWIFYTPAAGFTNTDTFTYTISDGYGGTSIGSVTVNVKSDNSQPQNFAIEDLGNGSFRITFTGIPGRTYTIQYTEQLDNPNWQTLASGSANSLGFFEYVDTPPIETPSRFYRSIYP